MLEDGRNNLCLLNHNWLNKSLSILYFLYYLSSYLPCIQHLSSKDIDFSICVYGQYMCMFVLMWCRYTYVYMYGGDRSTTDTIKYKTSTLECFFFVNISVSNLLNVPTHALVCKHMHIHHASWFSPLTIWFLVIKSRTSGIEESADLYHWLHPLC